jgi:hypothetical protein
MTPDAFRALRRLDGSTAVADATEFEDAFPASSLVTDRLWDLLEDSETVLLDVPKRTFHKHWGRVRPVARTNILVASVEAVHSRDGERSFRVSGAALREVHDLLVRRDRIRKRLAEATAGYRDENTVALRDAADSLDRRARARNDLASSFDSVSLSTETVERAFYHDDFDRSAVRPLTKVGV